MLKINLTRIYTAFPWLWNINGFHICKTWHKKSIFALLVLTILYNLQYRGWLENISFLTANFIFQLTSVLLVVQHIHHLQIAGNSEVSWTSKSAVFLLCTADFSFQLFSGFPVIWCVNAISISFQFFNSS